MKHMKAAEFKAKCLKVMDEVAATGEEVVVTKRGTPIVHVIAPPAPLPMYFGWGAGTVFRVPSEADLIAPIVDPGDWDFDETNLGKSDATRSESSDPDRA